VSETQSSADRDIGKVEIWWLSWWKGSTGHLQLQFISQNTIRDKIVARLG
jgi:hypothetical protein